MHTRRVLRNFGLVAAGGFGLSLLVACHDSGSPFGIQPISPVGRYQLVGCTYSDTDAAQIKPDCSYGGSGAVTHYDSGSLLLNDDNTMTRTLVVSWSALYPMPTSVTDTQVVVGRWAQDGSRVTAMWTSLPYAASTIYTRVDGDVLREGDAYPYFWYRRTP